MDLNSFFQNKAEKALMYQCIFSNINNIYELFELLKKLFYIGLHTHSNFLLLVNRNSIDTLNPYFKSLGFQIKYIKLDNHDLHEQYTSLINKLNNNQYTVEYKNNMISKVTFENIDYDTKKILKTFFYLNYFEKWYAPEHLHDYFILNEITATKCKLTYFDYFRDYSYLDG
jgi:hypothetical protein